MDVWKWLEAPKCDTPQFMAPTQNIPLKVDSSVTGSASLDGTVMTDSNITVNAQVIASDQSKGNETDNSVVDPSKQVKPDDKVVQASLVDTMKQAFVPVQNENAVNASDLPVPSPVELK
eukprot:NODE_368_length_8682_cov_0.309915.p7 type:complete len:119 gc:universal NODE_368_length_8682_cov_0.309915:8005-8361(+)